MAGSKNWGRGMPSRRAPNSPWPYALEEVVTNIIRHGYAGDPNLFVTIGFSEQEGRFQFAVEDQAPFFNPLEAPLPDLPQSAEDVRVGGQGITLLRKFADAIEYQPLERGNRLTVAFLATRPSLAVD